MKRVGFAAIGVLCALSGRSAVAQTVTATLVGTVTDPTGARVPGASVTATHQATNSTRAVRTDHVGNHTIRLLPPGPLQRIRRTDRPQAYCGR